KLMGLRPGSHVLRAEAAGAVGKSAPITIGTGEQVGVDLSLDAAASISGTVVEESGRPAAGVMVSFFARHGDDESGSLSADNGSFVVTRLAGGGTYRARVRVGGLTPGELHPP